MPVLARAAKARLAASPATPSSLSFVGPRSPPSPSPQHALTPPVPPPRCPPRCPCVQELCGIWAYIKWEVSGCPNRSKEEADREYQEGVAELTMLLRRWARARAGAAGMTCRGDLLAPQGPDSVWHLLRVHALQRCARLHGASCWRPAGRLISRCRGSPGAGAARWTRCGAWHGAR
jgi:hypothetical protein